MRTLFLGDSHSTGYYQEGDELKWWTENNYAEFWAKKHDKNVAIYAQPGGCNKKYPTWIKAMFEYYVSEKIDKVFLQLTYWNRYLMACSRNLDVGDGMHTQHFTYGPNPPPAQQQENIHRWTDERVSEDYVELVEQCRPENFEQFKGFDYREKGATADWEPFRYPYQYTKLWHESATHLQYRDWCSDMYVIDNIANDYGINVFAWTINDRVFVPENKLFYGEHKRLHFAPMSAEAWFKQEKNLNIEEMTNDSEHYIKEVHKMIGEEYLNYVEKYAEKA